MSKQPFLLDLHDEVYPRIRALRDEELARVGGGRESGGCLNTVTVTPDGDGGDDGPDEWCEKAIQ
ncbi:MAG: hypothetical protein D6740_08460 [Alphaproteobacteria bacterium]|nr:MAG: hypothetical protein D6740_08460 [Alphaproteobacteria bacterium]